MKRIENLTKLLYNLSSFPLICPSIKQEWSSVKRTCDYHVKMCEVSSSIPTTCKLQTAQEWPCQPLENEEFTSWPNLGLCMLGECTGPKILEGPQKNIVYSGYMYSNQVSKHTCMYVIGSHSAILFDGLFLNLCSFVKEIQVSPRILFSLTGSSHKVV